MGREKEKNECKGGHTKSKICKILSSFICHNFANFLGVQVRKSQIHNFFLLVHKSQIQFLFFTRKQEISYSIRSALFSPSMAKVPKIRRNFFISFVKLETEYYKPKCKKKNYVFAEVLSLSSHLTSPPPFHRLSAD
jgi:hypothetical protein